MVGSGRGGCVLPGGADGWGREPFSRSLSLPPSLSPSLPPSLLPVLTLPFTTLTCSLLLRKPPVYSPSFDANVRAVVLEARSAVVVRDAVFLRRLRLEATALDSQAMMRLDLVAALYVKTAHSLLEFDAVSSYESGSALWTYRGTMKGDWKAPFGISWLTLSNFEMAMTIDTAAASTEDKLRFFHGTGRIDAPFLAQPVDTTVSFFQGMKQYHAEVILKRTDLGAVVAALTSGAVASTTLEDVVLEQFALVFTSEAYYSSTLGVEMRPGVNVHANVTLRQGSDLSGVVSNLAPGASSATFIFYMHIPLDDDGNATFAKSKTPSFSLLVSNLGIVSNNLVLESSRLHMTLENAPSYRLDALLRWSNAGSSEAYFAVSSEYEHATRVWHMVGEQSGVWNLPFAGADDSAVQLSNKLIASVRVGSGVLEDFRLNGTAKLQCPGGRKGSPFALNAVLDVTVGSQARHYDVEASLVVSPETIYVGDFARCLSPSLSSVETDVISQVSVRSMILSHGTRARFSAAFGRNVPAGTSYGMRVRFKKDTAIESSTSTLGISNEVADVLLSIFVPIGTFL